jgi:hypothetical protein
MPSKGLPGRLSKGAGTHLASWLQESTELSPSEAQQLLNLNQTSARSTIRGERALAGLLTAHGKKAGHSKPITDVAYSGDLIISKDSGSMRLWRASGDYALLRVVSCPGVHVSVHSNGQFIVTGRRSAAVQEEGGDGGEGDDASSISGATRSRSSCLKVWGPSGGSAFTAGKKNIGIGRKVE